VEVHQVNKFNQDFSSPSFADDWDKHKNDFKVWRKFWALFELRKVWKWADEYYKKLDRTDNQIVASKFWSRDSGGAGFLNLCLWLAFLQSVYEGITDGLDDLSVNKKQKKENIKRALGKMPDFLIAVTKEIKDPLRNFRNAVFHCQWTPHTTKLNLEQETTNHIEQLHIELGKWINEYFNKTAHEFKLKYNTPKYWIGVNFMENDF
jgi:hypothetical protein